MICNSKNNSYESVLIVPKVRFKINRKFTPLIMPINTNNYARLFRPSKVSALRSKNKIFN